MAISTLAGARLMIAAFDSTLLADFMPFLKGFTLFFWAAGTWWIPLLLILGFWRHVYRRFPLRYDPQYWGLVFPFGMYTVCTFQLAKALNFRSLLVTPRYFIYLALAGWFIVSFELVYSIVVKNPHDSKPQSSRNTGSLCDLRPSLGAGPDHLTKQQESYH